MRVTQRGWIVFTVTVMTMGVTLGMLTADWCWYGRC